MAEVRVEVPNDNLAVLDGYCSASGRCRTEVICELLAAWSEKKLHESTVILRVAGVIPMGSESDRSPRGKGKA